MRARRGVPHGARALGGVGAGGVTGLAADRASRAVAARGGRGRAARAAGGAGEIGGGVRRAGAADPPAGRRRAGDARSVFLGWTAGDSPWLRYAEVSAAAPGLTERDLKELADGIVPSFGAGWDEPVFLVCTHGKRNVCCARLGVPLAQALATRHPGQVWETTHVGGHRFAANLVDPAARPLLRPGRRGPGRGPGRRGDRRVPARRGRGRTVPGPGRSGPGGPGGGVRAARGGRGAAAGLKRRT